MVPAFGLPTFTPFGLKLIAYMRLAGLDFRLVEEHDPRRGPKGKFPWLVDGPVQVADSDFVVRHLIAHHGADLDAGLDHHQRVVGHALRRMIEESLCFSILYYRWADVPTSRAATEVALGGMPWALRRLVRPLIRRRILRDLWGQGVGRHGGDEVAQLGCADLEALSGQLRGQDYLLGPSASALDASAAAFLAVVLYPPFDNPLKQRLSQLPNLVAYTHRMAERCFGSGCGQGLASC